MAIVPVFPGIVRYTAPPPYYPAYYRPPYWHPIPHYANYPAFYWPSYPLHYHPTSYITPPYRTTANPGNYFIWPPGR